MKNKMTDTQQIANFIDTLGNIRKAEGQVTETLKTVATNSKFKETFLKAMNKNLTTLEKALGDDSTMSKDDYEGQLHDAKAHLLLETATIPFKKPEDRK